MYGVHINNDKYADTWQSKIDPGAGRIEARIPLILLVLLSTEHTEKGGQIKRAKTESFVSVSSSLHTGEDTRGTKYFVH